MPDLNPQQAEAADKFETWWRYERHKRDFHLRGLAGTGKTWVLEKLMEIFDLRTAYCAPTGKAARVLSHRTGKKASTIHGLMYIPVAKEADEIRERLQELHDGGVSNDAGIPLTPEEIQEEMDVLRNRLLEIKAAGNSVKFSFREPEPDFADIIVADEMSMCGSVMGNDLEKIKIPKVIVCDPFQLPPVKDTWAYQDTRPDVFLTQNMRQGEGSGVAEACLDIRHGRTLRAYPPDFTIHKRGTVQLQDYPGFDMIIVGKNELRKRINKTYRGYMGWGDSLLVPGEKLMALNNQENGLSNGEIVIVETIHVEMGSRFICDLVDQYGNFFPMVECWKNTLRQDESQMDAPRSVGQFCYGYAGTVHKLQGSEAPNSLLLDSWGKEKPDYRRWLYTGASRASKTCRYVP